MNTAYGSPGPGRTVGSTRSAFSFFERHWAKFQKDRKRARSRADQCASSDHMVMDIHTARGAPDRPASCRSIGPRCFRSGGGWTLFNAVLCTACVLFANEATAQCAARDVQQNQLMRSRPASGSMSKTLVRSSADVAVWKKIETGTFSSPLSLANALNAAGCGIGNSAEKILARPAFTVSAATTNVELFAVSAAELGFDADTASLADIYVRAQWLGFGLAAAEIGPQLRLQYTDQPVGEFLIIAMNPIKTWEGEPVILTVANGGAGLMLIGQDGNADAQIPVLSRFLFARPSHGSDWAWREE
jgi:hypothetical protein